LKENWKEIWKKFERNFNECEDWKIINGKCFVYIISKFVRYLYLYLFSVFYVLCSMFYVLCSMFDVWCSIFSVPFSFVICDDCTKFIGIERITINIEMKSWRTNFVHLFYDCIYLLIYWFVDLLICLLIMFI
jgi:hypothetical protein